MYLLKNQDEKKDLLLIIIQDYINNFYNSSYYINLDYKNAICNFRSLNDSNFSLNSTIQEENADDNNDYIVYVTNTGRKYHSKGCSYLRSSCIPKKLSHVKYCYSPCSRCCP